MKISNKSKSLVIDVIRSNKSWRWYSEQDSGGAQVVAQNDYLKCLDKLFKRISYLEQNFDFSGTDIDIESIDKFIRSGKPTEEEV